MTLDQFWTRRNMKDGLPIVAAGNAPIYDYSEPSAFNCRIAIYNSASLHGETIASLTAAVERVKRASVVCTIVASAGLPLGHIQLAGGFTARTVVRKAFVLRLEEAEA